LGKGTAVLQEALNVIEGFKKKLSVLLVGAPVTAKAAPPVIVSGAMLFGIPVSDAVQYITLIYTLLLLVSKAVAVYHQVVALRSATRAEREAADASA
jgi:hypothetical protein